MDSTELKFLTRGLYIEADPAAGPAFRSAAVRLDELAHDTEACRPVAADAARLLVGLALGGAVDELGELLVPDPSVSENRWTVACYEMGGLTPVAVRDFDDPVEAIVTLSACPDEAHVAAELVASNEHGLRWTAVWRTDDHVSFQLPGAETAEADEEAEQGEHSEELLDALGRWRTRLTEWSGLDATAEPDEPRSASVQKLQALEQRLSGIESTLNDLGKELQAFSVDAVRRQDTSSAAVEHAIDLRFQVLSRVVQAALDRLAAQLVGNMQQKEVIERIDIIESRAHNGDDEELNVIDMRGSSA